MDEGCVVEIPAPDQSFGNAALIVVLWGVAAAFAYGSDDVSWPWAGPVVLALGPVAAVLALWAALTRRVIVASPDGVRVVWRPLALWDVVWIPRRELQVVSIDERINNDEDAGWFGTPSTLWAVVAVTPQGTVTLAKGYRDGEAARRVAEQIRQAARC